MNDAAPRPERGRWVGSWAAAPSDGRGLGPGRPLYAQTVRMVIRPTLSGGTARIRLSHRHGSQPAEIASATIGVRAEGAGLVPGTLRLLTFDGGARVRLVPGEDVVSDAVELTVEAGRDLVVSLHVPGLVARPTEHFITNQRGYLTVSGTGDHSRSVTGAAFKLPVWKIFSTGWFFLTGVDVLAEDGASAVVAFGDSITDGYQGRNAPLLEGRRGWNANVRYPDFLAGRLSAMSPDPRRSVLNTGISGNRILTDAPRVMPYGTAGTRRFADDVLSQPGVADVIIMEGINDLGDDADVTAADVTDGLRDLVDQARRAGIRVHLGTLTPALGASAGHGSAHTEQRRQAVNDWIRTAGVADSVADFDQALRDPAQPSRLAPAFDSGDHLHPSTAGYRAMARAVRL